jgi:hypothetical protein
MEKEMCLVDIFIINSIFREINYFQTLTRRTENILIITRSDMNIVGSVRATLVLPYASNNQEYVTLLSYTHIRKNGFHVITHEENNREFLHIIKKNRDGFNILKRISSLPSGLYYTYIKHVSHITYKLIFQNIDAFTTCHEHLEHLEVWTMRKIIGNSYSHNLNSAKFHKYLNFMCTACATKKLILRQSPIKIKVEPLKFFERI